MKEARLSALSVQMIVAATMIMSIGLVTPRLTESFQLSTAQSGVFVSIQFVGATLGCLTGGMLCTKHGNAFVTRACLAAASLCLAGFAFIPSYALALVGVFLIGFVAFVLENAVVSTAIALPERGQYANAVIQAMFCAGAIAIPLIFLFFSQWELWRPVYILLAAVALLVCLLTRGARVPRRGARLGGMLREYVTYLKKPSYMAGPIARLLYLGGETGLWSLAPTLLESTGAGRLAGIISAVLIWVMFLVGRLAGAMLMKKIPATRVIVPAGILGMVSYFLTMVMPDATSIVFMSLAGLSFAPFYAYLTTWSTQVAGDNSNNYVAFVMAFGTLGPVLVGVLVSLMGIWASGKRIILPGLCLFALMLLFLAAFQCVAHRRKKTSDASGR